MTDTWTPTLLGDCGTWLSGGTPSKARSDYWVGNIPWMSAKDMKQFRLYDAEDHISAEGAKNGTRVIPAGTILLLIRGMTLHNDVPICVAMTRMAFNQDVKAIVPHSNINKQFLAYWFVANKPYFLSLVDSASHGTGRLYPEVLKQTPILLPPPKEQAAIANVIGSIDDKIELNKRINETLENMAHALFQSWFVDFDPVRAHMEGRQPFGINAETATLFPETFISSPTGEIPTGWQHLEWGDIITLEYGKGLRDYASDTGTYPVYGTNGPIGTCDTPLWGKPGIIIGRKGAYRGIHFSSRPFFVIDTAFYVKPTVEMDIRWAYYAMSRIDLNSMDSGSAIPSTSRNDFYRLPTLFPSVDLQKRWAEFLAPVWQKQEQNISESKTLETLRDTLLPKLMSGEVRVRDAEKVVEDML